MVNSKPKTKVLTISLLCCGREETTERCLKSLLPLRNQIDAEIQVVDTGCSPATRAIVDKYADEVFEFKWINDFAAARNFQLEQANGEWFIYLDDDEFFLDVREMVDFFTKQDYKSYGVGSYIQKNYFDYDNNEYMDTRVIRMCRVLPEACFKGKVHEYIEPGAGGAILLDTAVGHYGYIFETEEENVQHSMRNIPLLLEMMDEDDNLRWPYQLAQEYNAIKDYKNLYELCDKYIKEIEDDETLDAQSYRGTFVIGKAIGLEGLIDLDGLVDHYQYVMNHPKINKLARARVCVYAAKAMFILSKFDECEEACDYYIKAKKELEHDEFQKFVQGGIFMDDTFSHNMSNHIYSYIITCGIKRGSLGPLEHYYKKITWNDAVIRINVGFTYSILEYGAKNGYHREIRNVIEKFNTRNALKEVLQNEIKKLARMVSVDELETLKLSFKENKFKDEFVEHIDLRIAERKMLKREWASFNEIKAELTDYANRLSRWYDMHAANSDEPMGPLSPTADIFVGRDLLQFVAFCDVDFKQAMEALKTAVSRKTDLNPLLVTLSKIYAEREKIQLARKQDPEKFEEMYKLEEAVLAQIAELERTGHGADASTTRGQLEAILMQTYGLKTLHS